MLLVEAKPIFRYVYHIAPVAALPNIRKQGLQPVTASTSSKWKHIKYDRPSIFVVTRKSTDIIHELLGMLINKYGTGDSDDIGEWTEEDWDKFLSTHILLTIDLSKCDDVDLIQDPNADAGLHSKILVGRVPPAAIVKVEPVSFD